MAFAPTTPGPFGRHTRSAFLAQMQAVGEQTIPLLSFAVWNSPPSSALVLLFDDEPNDGRRVSQHPALLAAAAEYDQAVASWAYPSAGLPFTQVAAPAGLGDYIEEDDVEAVPQGFRTDGDDLVLRGPAYILPNIDPGFVDSGDDEVKPSVLRATVELFGRILTAPTENDVVRGSIILRASDLTSQILEDRFVEYDNGGITFRYDVIGAWFPPLP